ncbi:SDR family NAD(P)-dependent oxidoreductase [Futiania mangrovi]|uniref:SDR family NAD(P)-dependent oxidoreductase n=1 Tax=Futiania mangrovi TaxID=2959716 RepID=A0A9J6PB41_9PROT|nr:SDR family NAD(P)-dependent oxidoreductase [Futiania mangrovii]MCP1336373.1 SDR family NAD(P)-dependent oxidoreductase [Futiania mangrovii]
MTGQTETRSAAVIGAGGGIGAAILALLAEDPRYGRIHAFARTGAIAPHPKVVAGTLDLADEASIAAAARAAGADGPLDLVFVATGLLHDGPDMQPEKDWRALDAERLARAFAVNATGPALVAKHFLPLLPREGRSVFAALSARVGSISDNRRGGWYAYRASKAALNMLLKTLSIELARKRPGGIVLGLQPGTVDTALSKPFQTFVADDKLFTPDFSAEKLLKVIEAARPEDTGGLFDWSGERIPY